MSRGQFTVRMCRWTRALGRWATLLYLRCQQRHSRTTRYRFRQRACLYRKVLYMMMAATIRSRVDEVGLTKSAAPEFRLCCGHTSYLASRAMTEEGRPCSVISNLAFLNSVIGGLVLPQANEWRGGWKEDLKQILENRGRNRVEFYHIYILYSQ
jgi:HAMP domain-containing protein